MRDFEASLAASSAVDPYGEFAKSPRELTTEAPLRLIKRYSNRKLYDTHASRYITLLEVAQLMLEGVHIQVVDNATREDKTELTFAQIILEQLKSAPPGGTRHRLTEIIRECQQAKGNASAGFPSVIPSPGTEAAQTVLVDLSHAAERATWQDQLERRLAVLPESQAERLRGHLRDLSNRVLELQRQIAVETENRPPVGQGLE